MQLVLETVIPVFMIIAAGWWCRRSGLLDEGSAKALNQYVFYIAIPPMMFLSTARVDIVEIVNIPFLSAYFMATALTMAIAFVGYRWFKVSGPLDGTVIALISGWGNTIYMGVPLFYFLFGEKGTLPVVMATLTTNMLFILGLAFFANMEASGTKRTHVLELFQNVFLKNPVMLSPILGVLFSFFALSIPVPVENLLEMIAPSAAPVALFSLGLSLYGLSFRGNSLQLGWMTGLKLVVHPLMAFLIVQAVELEPFWAASVVLMSALPTGAMVFVLAQQYDRRVDLASSTILSTTVLSVITLALILPLIKVWAG